MCLGTQDWRWPDDSALNGPLASKQFFDQVLPIRLEIGGNVIQDAAEGADPQWLVSRDGDMVLRPFQGGGESHVTASLTNEPVVISAQQSGQFLPPDVSGQSHTGTISSLTR